MDNNKFKGNWHEFKGEVKRKWGKLTDNDLLECEGDYEKFLGIVQKRYGEEKDAVAELGQRLVFGAGARRNSQKARYHLTQSGLI